ncbi:pseudouridine synthase [Sphingomonas sp.]|uniref:pseudouridine synthase n=1 Tax=Sphingomonas sp. TaxID=28214 RepID=UPI0035C8028F
MAEETSLHRIAKLLARAGVASRRDVERMIEDGRVALNGERLDTPATLLATLAGVTVDGEPVAEAEPTRLFLFHKPAGYLTAARDPMGRPTIYDRLPADLPRLVPVGRLDLNTEGLLLLTTDGEFKRQLELPSTGVERAYRARAYGDITQAQLEALIDGVEIDGIRYGSIDANLERRTGANVWVEMILTEGKNREVRRVLEYLGLQVSRLIRTRYGPFVMGDLPVGGIGEVRGADLVAFRNSLKGNTRLAPEQAGTITASAIRPGSAARPATSSRPRAERLPEPTSDRAPASARGAGYDPTHAPRAGSDRVQTRGAFGTGAARSASGEKDRTTPRAPAFGERGRTRAPQNTNEPDAARTRRQIQPPRPAPSAEQPRARPDLAMRGERSSDRATLRNRSGAIDPTHAARPFRDTAARGARQRPTPDDRDPRNARDTARPEGGRSQRQGRHAPTDAQAKPVRPRHDEPSDAPRPPRPERKPGWARAKPKGGAKPGTRPGKPRK